MNKDYKNSPNSLKKTAALMKLSKWNMWVNIMLMSLSFISLFVTNYLRGSGASDELITFFELTSVFNISALATAWVAYYILKKKIKNA